MEVNVDFLFSSIKLNTANINITNIKILALRIFIGVFVNFGVVRSYNETFFAFKNNKIIIRLSSPVFQIVMQEKGLTCISKKIEFHLSADLTQIEVLVMGKNLEIEELKAQFVDLKSSLWISTTVDNSDMDEKLRGIAKTSDGKVVFSSKFDNLHQGFDEMMRYANVDTFKNKSVIKDYCTKNVDLLNNQIRLLTQEKNLYLELSKNL